MDGENKFFFEEDSDTAGATGVSAEEQADIFGNILSESGVTSSIESMAPMVAQPVAMSTKKMENAVAVIEYGIVDKDYVLHITPVHPQRNLSADHKLNAALKAVVISLNEIVPFDLQVMIHPPQEDWKVKALSFVIKEGAEAWNFDREKFEDETVHDIAQKITDICVKP